MRLALALVVLGACSFPEKELVDGNGPPFGCINAPNPTKAENPVVISGLVVNAGTNGPFDNAAVSGLLAGNPTSIFDVHTGANGTFSHQQNTGNIPLDLYLSISANTFFPTYFYPAYVVTHSIAYPRAPMSAIQMFDQMTVDRISMGIGMTVDPTKGHLLLNIEDCNGTPLSGATVTTSPAGTVRYFVGITPSMTATSTDSLGVVLVANLPPGNVTVNATARGMALKQRNMQVVAGAFNQAEIGP